MLPVHICLIWERESTLETKPVLNMGEISSQQHLKIELYILGRFIFYFILQGKNFDETDILIRNHSC